MQIQLAILLLASLAASSSAEVLVAQVEGIVQVDGVTISDIPHLLSPGDKVGTGLQAKATILFEDGSRVDLGADSVLLIEEAAAKRFAMRLSIGSLKAVVVHRPSRRFEVRTPTSYCNVRGTEFDVYVYGGGRTRVDLFKGQLGIEDNRGHATLLRPGESLLVDQSGMGVPRKIPSRSVVRRTGIREHMRRELHFAAEKDDFLSSATREVKLGEYQQGKVLVDSTGHRVRVEEFILRPRADQFKLVILNGRSSRFDYFYFTGTFNKTLPEDLSGAFGDMVGGLDTQPGFFLTGYETGRSNKTDSILEIAQGGHPVDLNGNADATDDRTTFFDAGSDGYVAAAGRRVYQTLFDRYGFYLNGRLKYGWTGTNLQSYGDRTGSATTDPLSGAVLTSANAYLETSGNLAARSVNTTFPNNGEIHQQVSESYSDGASLTWDNYAADVEGRVAALERFGSRTGDRYRERLLDFNYQQVISASEFGTRKIDLVIAPKILIHTGLIQ